MTAQIQLADRPEVRTAGIRRTVPMTQLTDFFSHAFTETMRVISAQGAHPAGPPFGKYYGMPGATVCDPSG